MATRTIAKDGAELSVEDNGRDGPALVFSPLLGWFSPHLDSRDPPTAGTDPHNPISQRGWGGSRAMDRRYDLDALANDVTTVAAALGIGRYVLVGHSISGKVAQLVAGQRLPGLTGLVLVAPAPPIPMQVPAEVRAAMLA